MHCGSRQQNWRIIGMMINEMIQKGKAHYGDTCKKDEYLPQVEMFQVQSNCKQFG